MVRFFDDCISCDGQHFRSGGSLASLSTKLDRSTRFDRARADSGPAARADEPAELHAVTSASVREGEIYLHADEQTMRKVALEPGPEHFVRGRLDVVLDATELE